MGVSNLNLEVISNSTLSWVKMKVNHLSNLPSDDEYLEFGRIAEDYILHGVEIPRRTSMEWRDQFERMKVKFYENRILSYFVDNKEFKSQDVFKSEFLELPFKAKFSGSRKDINIGLEYKSMLCNSLHQFKTIINRLDYDRECYVNMNVAKMDYMYLVGQSKRRSAEVFPVVVTPGDEIYESGRVKTEELVGLYKLYFQ